MFGLGMTELIIILVVVLVLFGAGKLPGVMGEFGRGISMFKKGMSGEDVDEASHKKVGEKEEDESDNGSDNNGQGASKQSAQQKTTSKNHTSEK